MCKGSRLAVPMEINKNKAHKRQDKAFPNQKQNRKNIWLEHCPSQKVLAGGRGSGCVTLTLAHRLQPDLLLKASQFRV